MRSLTDLANHYGSDKGTRGPSSQWPVHNYTDVYEAYLAGIRTLPITLLEVGLGVRGDAWNTRVAHGRNEEGGASIKMWQDYFPNATIFGADIHDASFLDNDRVTTRVVDQGRRADLEALADEIGTELDVVVDDGSHRPDHQQVTFAALFPRLKPGGLYFIEDLMRNGHGDPDRGRFSASDVLNTRELFRSLADTGTFPEPHALTDADALAKDIESVALHCPAVRISAEISFDTTLRARGSQPVVQYPPRSEKLCVVRKAS